MKVTNKVWHTSRREFDSRNKTFVMGILNVTPDSFSDGGKFANVDAALRKAEEMLEADADILDIGGESTRPNSTRVSETEEIRRVVPVIKEIVKRFDCAISIDTTKSQVARASLEAGAEIINDISGLRWDPQVARVAAEFKAGLVLMHLRGTFETMHRQEPVEHILPEVIDGLRESAQKALSFGVSARQIAVDIGIGFSKTMWQNLKLLAELDKICDSLTDFPVLVGTSRKSFIGKLLNNAAPDERLYGSMASVAIAVFNGANIIRVHDVRAAVETTKIADAIKLYKNRQDELDKS